MARAGSRTSPKWSAWRATSSPPRICSPSRSRASATPGIDRIFRMLPRREMLVERLAKTGRTISVGQYMMVTIGVIAGLTVVLLIFTSFGLLPNLLIGIALGIFIPHYLIGRMGRK